MNWKTFSAAAQAQQPVNSLFGLSTKYNMQGRNQSAFITHTGYHQEDVHCSSDTTLYRNAA